MDRFQDGHRVWLRSRAHGTYLYANEDGRSVSLHPNRDSVSAIWIVHLLLRKSCDYRVLLLHSAAYGRYLAATGTPASRGHRVGLLDFDDMNEFDIRWLGIASTSENDDIILHHLYYRGNLCVGSKKWFKNNAAALNIQAWDNISTASPEMLWVVEDSPPKLLLPPQLHPQLPRDFGLATRIIRVSKQNNDECRFLLFMGNSLLNLKCKIHELVGSGYTLYVRAGIYGRLTPLIVDLCRSNESIDLVVLPIETETDNVRARAVTPFGQIECGGVGLSVANVFCSRHTSNSKQQSNPTVTKLVWLVGNAAEAQQSILQWELNGKPDDAGVTVAGNIPFSEMKSIMLMFQLAGATPLLKRLEDNAKWLCEYRVLTSISHLPHPPKEIVSRFRSGTHSSVNTGALQPWIVIDI